MLVSYQSKTWSKQLLSLFTEMEQQEKKQKKKPQALLLSW